MIVGNLANTVTLGGYSGDPTLQVNAVQGITDAIHAVEPGRHRHLRRLRHLDHRDRAGVLLSGDQAAITVRRPGDRLRRHRRQTVASEGNDRASLTMPGNYNSLINQVAALGNPRTALVIQSDGPVDISATQGDFPAIVFSGYNGESQGTALADVLLGKQNPSGHLDFTWYQNDSQLPAMDNYGLTPSQTGGFGRTYMYFTGTPTYPFGYGLSYTTFTYSHVHANTRSVHGGRFGPGGPRRDEHRNRGRGDGRAAVRGARLHRPRRSSCRASAWRASQRPACSRRGSPSTSRSRSRSAACRSGTRAASRRSSTTGTYQFQVGADAADAAGTVAVDVRGTITPRVQYVTVQPDQAIVKPGDTLNLTGKNPWIANDTSASLEQPHATADNIVEAVNDDESFVDLAHARVRYSSSDPAVATVNRAGVVTALGAGVTTLRVTVNGVTGTAPIVVKQPFTLTAPAIVGPGDTVTATTTFPNTGPSALRNLSMALTGPAGWTVTATSPATFAGVASGQTVRTTWSISAPASVASGGYTLKAEATFTGSSGTATSDAPASIAVPYTSLASAFGNTGISDDSNTGAGSLDGGGLSYSAQALAAAGLTPGAAITHDGIGFTWPSAAAGSADNAVATGQTFALSGAGITLGFLGTGDWGTASGTGTITYTDGTTQQFGLSFSDWWSNAAQPGGDILASVPYINTASGKQTQQVSVYYAGVPLQAGKTVRYVTLPDAGDAVNGSTAMHIFAVGFGCCSFDVTAPATVTPGQTVTVRTILANASGAAVTNAAASLSAPSDWTATANGAASAASLGAGQSLPVTWSVAVPASAACGAYRLHGTATLTTTAGTALSLPQDAAVNIVCQSLSAAFDNTGITADSSPGGGNFDGGGQSYSDSGLPAPGSTVTVQTVNLTWPSATAGTADNVVAEGQTVDLSGSGSTLVFLGAADYGTASGTGTITYADGTTQSFSLTFADWYADAPQAGGTLVATSHVNTSGGPGTQQAGIYSATVELQSGKTVASVTLPAVSSGVAIGTTAMHIFAIGL